MENVMKLAMYYLAITMEAIVLLLKKHVLLDVTIIW
jgi:hypothetical protein